MLRAEAGEPQAIARFASDVQRSLTREPRELPARYFYDALGSALFEAICQLPWYGITRAESRLLEAHRDEIHERLDRLSTIVELGPGSGTKLKTLLESGRARRRALEVHLIDVSIRALETAAGAIERVEDVRIVTHAAEYDAGLREVGAIVGSSRRTLVLFLGSNIGNFDPSDASALLDGIRRNVSAGDALLLGTDLVKPEHHLRLAYDDPLGVTAAFNRNLLIRINRELGGNFAVREFAHEAVWNAVHSRVEMHLVARSTQHVRIPDAGLEFTMREGERIWTESSYKYRPGEVSSLLRSAGFEVMNSWIDDRDRFLLTLAEAVAAND